ncbi:unnamed protein product [Closterium sp. NIES-54]
MERRTWLTWHCRDRYELTQTTHRPSAPLCTPLHRTPSALPFHPPGTVPVYYGAPDVAHLAPPGSFIDMRAFPNKTDVGVLINQLDANASTHFSSTPSLPLALALRHSCLSSPRPPLLSLALPLCPSHQPCLLRVLFPHSHTSSLSPCRPHSSYPGCTALPSPHTHPLLLRVFCPNHSSCISLSFPLVPSRSPSLRAYCLSLPLPLSPSPSLHA